MKIKFTKLYTCDNLTFPINSVGHFDDPGGKALIREGYGSQVPDETRARLNADETVPQACVPSAPPAARAKEKPPTE